MVKMHEELGLVPCMECFNKSWYSARQIGWAVLTDCPNNNIKLLGLWFAVKEVYC